MCHNHSLNHKIYQLHERCLQIIYCDKKSSFDKLLDKDESFSVRHQNIQKPCIEMFKVLKGQKPQIVNVIFCIIDETSYELQERSSFFIPSVIIIFIGTERIQYQTPWKSKGFQNSNKETETNIMPM